jgi:flagellar motility protein MotE (MotC chaperone)
MTRILQSSWLTALAGCLVYLAVTAALLRPGRFQDLRMALPSARPGRLDEPSWRYRNPEFDQWVQEIQREKEALAVREQQLRDLQARIEAERQELNNVTQSIHRLQIDFDKNVVRIKDQELENLRRQARVMSGMSAEGAAGLLGQMPDDDAVRILYAMKTDEASVILDTYSKLGKNEARRAAAITERMRRLLPPDPAGGRTRTSL